MHGWNGAWEASVGHSSVGFDPLRPRIGDRVAGVVLEYSSAHCALADSP
nr:hypothetical protein JVH1_6782 [Rhodococcus sp. JVH1]